MIQVKVITPFNNFVQETNSINGVSIVESDYVLFLDEGVKQFVAGSFIDSPDTEAKITTNQDILVYSKISDAWICTSGAVASASAPIPTPIPLLPN